MSEKKFRSRIVELLAAIGAFPIENIVHDGTPDVGCVAGFIELKVAKRPRRESTRVEFDLRPSQRIWLRKWREHGGRAWTLVRLEETVMLHDALWASEHMDRVSEEVLRANAVKVWETMPDQASLIRALTGQQIIN